MKTVYEQAVEMGEKTFPGVWRFIQERVADSASHETIAAQLQVALKARRMSAQFWRWVEDATTAAKHNNQIEAEQRRRKFRLVK